MADNKMTVKDAYEEHMQGLEVQAKEIAKTIPASKVAALMLSEAQINPELYQCMKSPAGRTSLLNFFMLSARLGLEPGSAMGLLYATPRRNKAQQWTVLPIIGYKGYCELAHRSGKIKRIAANPFYQDDVDNKLIKITKEPPDVQHDYDVSVDEDDDKLVGVYAIVETKSGGKYILVMNRDRIIKNAKRGGSWGASFSPWKSDFAAMARKTVLRGLLSGGLVPLSSELRQALAEDVDAPEVDWKPVNADPSPTDEESPPPEPEPSGHDELKDALGMDNGGGNVIDGEYEEVSTTGEDSPFPDEPQTMV